MYAQQHRTTSRRSPLLAAFSVPVAFGIGLLLGTLIHWMLT